jgi:hypothetical protein
MFRACRDLFRLVDRDMDAFATFDPNKLILASLKKKEYL